MISSGEQEGDVESPRAATRAAEAGDEVEQVQIPFSEKRESVYPSSCSEQYAYFVSHSPPTEPPTVPRACPPTVVSTH